MNYIYDIVLNFQKNYYNFFEWRKDDKIKNISKIPLYKVTNKDLLNLKYNEVTIDKELISKIKEDTKKNKNIICLVSNELTSIGLLFDEEGNILKRSSLIFEEEDEVNDDSKKLPILDIKYIKNKEKKIQNKLRIEIEKKDTLINYIINTNNITTLKYLYYECFEEECDEINIIKNRLLKELKKEWNIKQNNLYNVVNLLMKN